MGPAGITNASQADGDGDRVGDACDRSGNSVLEVDACSTFVRSIDPGDTQAVLLDRSDAVVEFPDLAGTHLTVTPFRSNDVAATATLDANRTATLALPASQGTAFCLRIARCGGCD